VHRPEHWEDGAPFVTVAVTAVRSTVWEHSASPYFARTLRVDNPTAGAIRVWVTCYDEKTSRSVELRLGAGGGDAIQVWGALKVEAIQLDAAGTSLTLSVVETDDAGSPPSTDVRVVLPNGAPGAWTDVGWLPSGRRWCTVAIYGDLTNADVALTDAANNVLATWTQLAGSDPRTFIHAPSLKLRARANGPNNVQLVAAWAAR